MTPSLSEVSTYFLIDNGMLTAGDSPTIAIDKQTAWLACVYEENAATVSPYVIDIEAAHEAGEMNWVMALVNATPGKLHVSVIDTTLTLEELVQHLRRFIMVRCANGKSVTLRFADGAVLPQLAIAFTPAQWSALARPMVRWQVHGYDSKLSTLPCADTGITHSATPLVLMQDQLTALDEAMLPNRVLANLRAMRHWEALPGTQPDQHRWANHSARLWRDAGHADTIVLRWLTEAALDTHGAVLEPIRVGSLLAQSDLHAIRAELNDLVVAHQARSYPTEENP